METANFADRLHAEMCAKRSRVVVGLDPDWDALPQPLRSQAESQFGMETMDHDAVLWALREFCEQLISATAHAAVAFKPQVAFFERWGSHGFAVLERLLQDHEDQLFILDGKRGDIANTSKAYAAAYFHKPGEAPAPLRCDAVTVNAYMGRDVLEPYLPYFEHGKGAFVLDKTSNPSSADLQDMQVENITVFEHMARKVAEWGEPYTGECGFSSLGLVVGATFPEAAAAVRRIAPQNLILVPGIGTQGGRIEDARAFCDQEGRGAIFNFSRAIAGAYAGEPFKSQFGPAQYAQAAGAAAELYRDKLNEVLGVPA
jgi:orotidine-5'-phosphate decarboxylase